jgi:hypothetical protein
MPAFDLRLVKEMVEELDPELRNQEDDLGYRVAVVLLSAVQLGPDVAKLSRSTGYEMALITDIWLRMQRAELWNEMDVCCDHWFLNNMMSSTQFWLDVLVAEGLAQRRWSDEKGDYTYRVAENPAIS